jgi:hypothetical protein
MRGADRSFSMSMQARSKSSPAKDNARHAEAGVQRARQTTSRTSGQRKEAATRGEGIVPSDRLIVRYNCELLDEACAGSTARPAPRHHGPSVEEAASWLVGGPRYPLLSAIRRRSHARYCLNQPPLAYQRASCLAFNPLSRRRRSCRRLEARCLGEWFETQRLQRSDQYLWLWARASNTISQPVR